MINRLAKLLALTAAFPCAGLGVMPDTAIHEDGVTVKTSLLSSARLVSDEELSGMRGGYFTAAGAQFDFGASVQTLVNGKLALQTNLQWTPNGAVTQQLQGLQGLGTQIQSQVASQVADNLAKAGIATPAAAMQTTANVIADSTTPQAAATSMPATQTASNTSTGSGAAASAPAAAAPAATAPVTTVAANTPAASTAAPAASAPAATSTPANTSTSTAAPVTISVPTSGDVPKLLTGVQIPGATGGSTTVFANVGGGSIQNVILNSASGQDITQNTNVTLTIYNFAAWQASVAQHMLSARLASDMLAASGLSTGH
jgi:hypothetical protein